MEEIWKDIIGFENEYQISNLGNVKSLKFGKEKILKQQLSNSGYLMVHLRNKTINKVFQVHRLVALHFIENPNNYRCVNHKDENRLNNAITNLEWCTDQYNTTYGSAIRKRVEHTDFSKIGLTTRKKLAKPVIQLTLKGEFLKEWECLNDVHKELGYDRKNIGLCCKGIAKQAHGYKWMYKSTPCGILEEE